MDQKVLRSGETTSTGPSIIPVACIVDRGSGGGRREGEYLNILNI